MKTENGKIDGNHTVSEAFTLYGMVTGSIHVVRGGSLQLHGMCNGNLVVDQGGTAMVFGMVVSDIRNQGTIEVRGTVKGSVFTRGANFQKAPGAVILGTIEA